MFQAVIPGILHVNLGSPSVAVLSNIAVIPVPLSETWNLNAGPAVPMPTLPEFLSTQNKGELVPTANKAFWVGVEDAM